MNKSDDLNWGRSIVQTACPLDCPDTCSLSVSLEKGRIVKIDGSTRHDVTNSFICGKVRRFGDRIYGENRLQHVGLRKGKKGEGRFSSTTWDEALEIIAKKIHQVKREWGGEAILPFSFGGSNGLVTQDTVDAELFRHLGASRLARTVCGAPTGAAHSALYGKMPGVAYEDYQHAKLIIIWGANPSVSGIHLVPHIRKAVNQGAALVVIDPRRTSLAKQADIHLDVRPGSDVAVALAIHRFLFNQEFADNDFLKNHTTGVNDLRARAEDWTFERAATVADVDPDLIERVAELYAETSPAVIRCGYGVERNRNGGNAAAAILSLPAVAGKFGVRGSGFSMSDSGAWNIEEESWINVKDTQTRIINMNQIGRALTNQAPPPIKILFVYNSNPVATMPDQNRILRGLARDDLFVIVFDQVMTDTAKWADVVLPATTFLEHYDIARSYGQINLQLIQPVIEPTGDSRPNVEVFSMLAKHLNISTSKPFSSDPESVIHVAQSLPDSIQSSLLEHGIATSPVPTKPIQFENVFPATPDKKINLFPEELEVEAPKGLYSFQGDSVNDTYPLILLSPASEKSITSTLGELRKRLAALQMHPNDATQRNLSTGDIVRVFNDLGEIQCPLMINSDMKAGTVGLPKGLWQKSTMNGSTTNALISDTTTDLGGGARFNDTKVEVTRIVTASLGDEHIALWTTTKPERVN